MGHILIECVVKKCHIILLIICRDYQKEYEKLRDEKFSVSAKADEEKLTKIMEQGPGSVVELNSLVSGVNFHLFCHNKGAVGIIF